MNKVDDPVSKRALAFETALLGAITLTWHVISRAVEGVVVSDGCVLTLAFVFLLGFNFPCSRRSNACVAWLVAFRAHWSRRTLPGNVPFTETIHAQPLLP